MSIYVLDGYNVIHAVPEFERQLDRSLEAAREALIRHCCAYQGHRGDVERIYVIFDGDERYAHLPQQGIEGVSVLFTARRHDADERILSLIRNHKGVRDFIIVTNDIYVFNNSRAHGARAMSVGDFYAKSRPTSARPRTRAPDSDRPAIPPKAARDITERYRRHLEKRDRAGPES